MGVYDIEGPDGKVYEVEAPDMQSAAAAFQKMAPQQPAPTGSVYQQFPSELSGPTGNAALMGASDAQMGDIVQKSLGERFIKREKTKDGYEIFTTRGPDGKEQRSYLNQPGLDREDVARGIRGALPYFLTGGAAGVATRGMGLAGQSIGQLLAGGATSLAGDAAQMPMGSEQGLELPKAGAVAGFSAAGPVLGKIAGNVAGALKERFAPLSPELSGMSRKAIGRVEEGMAADGNLTPQSYAAARQSLGDEAMLGDMGRTLQTDTARLGRIPVSSDPVINALERRQFAAGDRIKADLDANLGAERNLPQYMDAQQKAYRAQAKPFYDQFYQAPILTSQRLLEIMSRVPRSAISGAEKLARADGIKQKFRLLQSEDAMSALTGAKKTTAQRVVQGVEYDYLKRAIDDLAKDAAPGSNAQRIYGNLARDLRGEVDSILSPSDPTLSPWAKARSIAGEGLEGKEAVEVGAGMFSKKKDPHIVANELSGMSAFGKDMAREGGRNDLRQVMGRAGSNFSSKADTGARRVLNNDFGRENIEQIAGPTGAANITRRIDAENHMAQLYDMAKGNSITSTMEASKVRWPTPTENRFASDAGKKGPVGIATETVFKIADMMLGGQLRKAEAKAALDGANILTAQGKKADKIVESLFRHIEARKAGRMSAAVYERNMRRLAGALRIPAAQAYTD